MSSPTVGPDSLFAALDPLVRDGTLSPTQADRVYRAVTSRLPPVSADDGRAPTGPPGWSLSRVLAATAVVGAGLGLGAFWITSVLIGANDFAWKTFLALGSVVALMSAGAGASRFLLRDRRHGRWLTGVFASLAVLTLPVTAMVTWELDLLVYAGGVVMIAGGVGGFWVLRSHPATLLAAVGGLVILGQVFSDTFEYDESGFRDVTTSGVAALVYGLAVGAAGWKFACRNTTGLAGGLIALGSMYYVIFTLGIFGAFVYAFGGRRGGRVADIHSDIRLAMLLGLLVTVGLVVAHAWTGHIGYLIESFVGAVSLPFAGVLLSRTDHPLRWAFAIGLVGAVAVAVGLVMLLRRGETGGGPAGSGAALQERAAARPPPPHLGPGEPVGW